MPSLTRAQALARYADACGPAKRAQSVAIVKRYLDAGGTAKDADLARYLRGMEAGGYAPSTIGLHRRMVRAFFRALGMRPPYAVLAVEENTQTHRPALSVDLGRRLIAAARTDAVDPWTRGLVAVSTLYGPRAVELSWLRAASWRAPDTLFLRAAKGSAGRALWWPPGDVLASVREGPWPVATVGAVERRMDALWAAADLARPAGVSWHALRRGLAAALAAAGIDEDGLQAFMGWKGGKRSMAMHYAHPSAVVGADGVEAVVPEADARTRDAAVWAVHPWVGAWQD